MKWKLICVLIISLLSISVIACWPYAPPPPPPPPPLHLFEDHYVRYQGPYEPGLTHMASHSSAQAMPPVSGHQMSQHLFYPIPSMNPIPSMSYAEPQERIFDGKNDFDFGNTQEFGGYIPREPTMMKVRHMNYRYRKRLKTQRPIEANGFSHPKEVQFSPQFSQQYSPHQPRRFNVIDSRGEYQKKIPNSVNDKLAPNQRKVFNEEESNPQNSSLSKTSDKTDRKIETKSTDLQENGSQTNDIPDSTKHPVDMPIEVTSYAMKSPDGAVTQVTEMLYDVENNPFKSPTSSPILTPVWTPVIKPVTDNPFITQTPYLKSAFSESDASTAKSQPINTAVTAQFNDITMSPVLSFTSQRNTGEPMYSTAFTPDEARLAPTPPRLRTPSASDYYSRRARKKSSTQKPSSTTSRSFSRESKAGLSGAAIAGIVIGSMVSVMLLAGTSLLVMYRNPFRRSLRPQSVESLPNVRSTDNTSAPQVQRWQPRRQRRL